MSDTIWGDPIGMTGIHPGWLRPDEKPMIMNPHGHWVDPTEKGSRRDNKEWAWVNIRAIKLPADHPYYAVQRHNAQNRTNFTYWPGGENAPDDWDGGIVLAKDTHSERILAACCEKNWSGAKFYAPIIGYTRRAEPVAAIKQPAEWAITRVIEECRDAAIPTYIANAFARYIEQHEQPPVDPDVLAVREILAATYKADDAPERDVSGYRNGEYDADQTFCAALAAYRKHRQ